MLSNLIDLKNLLVEKIVYELSNYEQIPAFTKVLYIMLTDYSYSIKCENFLNRNFSRFFRFGLRKNLTRVSKDLKLGNGF